MVINQIFRLPNDAKTGTEVWKVQMEGKVLPIEFNSKGAAEAGLKVELDRQEKRNRKYRV